MMLFKLASVLRPQKKILNMQSCFETEQWQQAHACPQVQPPSVCTEQVRFSASYTNINGQSPKASAHAHTRITEPWEQTLYHSVTEASEQKNWAETCSQVHCRLVWCITWTSTDKELLWPNEHSVHRESARYVVIWTSCCSNCKDSLMRVMNTASLKIHCGLTIINAFASRLTTRWQQNSVLECTVFFLHVHLYIYEILLMTNVLL